MKKRDITLGTDSEERFRRQFVVAWPKASQGDIPETLERAYIAEAATLTKVLSEKRIVLLRCLRQRPHLSIRALAKALQRDYSNVHADVTLLKRVGLIEDSNGLVVPYVRIRLDIELQPPER